MASVSIGQLFLAGVVPGILMGITMMLTVAYFAYTRNFGRDVAFSALKLAKAALEVAMVLGIPYAAWWVSELGVPGGWTALGAFALILTLDRVFRFSAVMALLTPVLLIGGMTLGIFTPTEGAIAASIWALFLGLVW
jgi:TRAP-type C4-dicarboxylate transport system permease large subunit